MKITTILLAFLGTVVICGSSSAITILDPGYTVETYVTYADSVKSVSRHMALDASGNLYVAQYGTAPGNGSIWRVTPARVASQFVGGLTSPYSITWGGGTSFGDYLYVGDGRIAKVGLDGSTSTFASHSAVSSLAIDITGNYGGYLYAGTGASDDIHSVDVSGNLALFSSWPGSTSGGEPDGIAFDPGTDYGQAMYVATAYEQANANKSGLFTMNPTGTPTRFSNDLVQAWTLAFDDVGQFGGELFAMGRTSYSSPTCIFRVGVDGDVTQIATSPTLNLGMAFGPDGAMYVSEYSSLDGIVTISRVTPEPASALIMVVGAVIVASRRKRR